MSKSNFEFLKGVNDFLFTIASDAEKNFPDDPNGTLTKLRVFGEKCANHLAVIFHIEAQDSQHELLRELAKIELIDDTLLNTFHTLRKIGNKASHQYHNDLSDAEMCLRLVFRLSVWYYRLISKDYNFAVPVFVLPTSTAVDHEQQIKAEAIYKEKIKALEVELTKKNQQIAEQSEAERKAYKQAIVQPAVEHKLEIDLSEQETRFLIDAQLRKAGWDADSQTLNFANGTRPQIGRNIAIAEWPTALDETGHTGFADYVLFVGLKPIGVVEAKKANKDVMGKLPEAYRYSKTIDLDFLQDELKKAAQAANDEQTLDKIAEVYPSFNITWPDSDGKPPFKIPFCFSANGREYRASVKTKSGIWYRDVRLTTNMAHALPEWHSPQELVDKLAKDTLSQNDWFKQHPDMDDLGLRYYQVDAVKAVESAIINQQRDILLAMATGTGKTRTAIAIMYRLIQSQRFNRILFLVDRTSLGKQALGAFEETRIKGDTFNAIFNIQGLTDRFPETSTKVHVATVQSLVKRTLQSDEIMPVGRYDCIIVDEAHRGYILDKEQTEGEEKFRDNQDFISSYRRIIDHFDAVKIALTATPALHTTEIFNQPVYRYSYRTAVVDGYLCDQEPPIKIITKLARDGAHYHQGTEVERLSNQGELINDCLADDQDFEVADFNRSLIAPEFNRVVCEELVKYIDPINHINPAKPQKTLVFCVNNDHADMVVEELRRAFKAEFPQLEHDAIVKITGDSDKDSTKVQSMIDRYKMERLPNIVVTVDLLSTGVDIPSICNIVFMRKVRSRILYEQMKGRATRLCPESGKTSFRIFDAVDLYSSLESVDTMKPVVVRPKVELTTLISEIANPDTHKTLEADGRSFAEHSHEQLIAKLQRITTHAQFNRDKSKPIANHLDYLNELCTNVAECDFSNLAKTMKEKGVAWSSPLFAPTGKLTNLASRLKQLKTDINGLRDMPIFSDIPDQSICLSLAPIAK